jgi:hypothetical protein
LTETTVPRSQTNPDGRPVSPNKPDSTVWEPESLKKAREVPGMTDEQARREQHKNKGQQVW